MHQVLRCGVTKWYLEKSHPAFLWTCHKHLNKLATLVFKPGRMQTCASISVHSSEGWYGQPGVACGEHQ